MVAFTQSKATDGVGERQDESGNGEPPRSLPKRQALQQDIDAPDEISTLMQLAKTIEGEIIPRLLLAHKMQPNATGARREHEFGAVQVAAFARTTYAFDSTLAYAVLDEARSEEVPLENIILDLFAPAARHLGDLWKTDDCTFTEVTVGLSRLRQMLRELSPEFEDETSGWRHGRRALLLPAPGEQHTFGLFVVEAFFRREGWDVSAGPARTPDEISKLVEQQWFAIAGFSLSSEKHIDRLASMISAVRKNSQNRKIGILVGGQIFVENPALITAVGADGGAADGREAVIEALNLLGKVGARQ